MLVEDLLARISPQEFADWQTWARTFGPLGPKRRSYEAAIVARAFAGGRLAEHLLWARPVEWTPELLAAAWSPLGAEINDGLDDRQGGAPPDGGQ